MRNVAHCVGLWSYDITESGLVGPETTECVLRYSVRIEDERCMQPWMFIRQKCLCHDSGN
jgi:hypothetical protein